MRSLYLALLVTVGVVLGCDMIKSHMPAPTANKAVSVPVEAKLVAMGSPEILSLPADRPGTYYFAEDDTNKIISVVNIEAGQPVMTPELRAQLEPKRKYRVYLMGTGTGSTTTPARSTTTPPASNPPSNGNPLSPAPSPATTPVM